MRNNMKLYNKRYVCFIAAAFIVIQYVVAAAAIRLQSESQSASTANFYLLASVNMASPPSPDNIVNLYELNYSPLDGSMQSKSLTGWNISQIDPDGYDPMGTFYTIDPDVGQENIYILAHSGSNESLSSYSVPLNKTSDIFTNQQMPDGSSDYVCAKYDRSTKTAYSIGYSPNSTTGTTTVLIVALSDAQGFAVPSKPIFQRSFQGIFSGFGAMCALIPADVSGASTALFSFIYSGDTVSQLFTISVTPTVGTLYASPGVIPSIAMIEPTLVKNAAQNPTLFYSTSTISQPPTFGTIDILTGLSDVLIPQLPTSCYGPVAFEPRVTPPMLTFVSSGMGGSMSEMSVLWTTIGIEQTAPGEDYDRIVYINSGNFTIPAQMDPETRLIGLLTVGLNGAAGVKSNSQSPLIADL